MSIPSLKQKQIHSDASIFKRSSVSWALDTNRQNFLLGGAILPFWRKRCQTSKTRSIVSGFFLIWLQDSVGWERTWLLGQKRRERRRACLLFKNNRLHSKQTNPPDAQEGQALQSSLGNGLQNIQGKQPWNGECSLEEPFWICSL